MFNRTLEVGQPALVIGTRIPENSWLIGSVVIVEAFTRAGEDVGRFFELPDNVRLAPTKTDSVLVSECKKTGKTKCEQYSMKAGYTFFSEKYLMPIPKLKDKEIQKEKELDLA